MADDNLRVDEERVVSGSSSGRRWLLFGAGLLAAFLLGLLPMWWAKMGVNNDLEQASRDLRRQQIQNSLAAAAVYARRGEYETARQNASAFFTDVQAELDKTDSTAFSQAEKTQIPAVLAGRDEIITLLSRADPASAERLSDVYVTYRSSVALRP